MPNNVDFPDPFSPSTPWISPASQSSDTSESACTVPNRFDTESMTRSGDLVELLTLTASASRTPDIRLRVHRTDSSERGTRRDVNAVPTSPTMRSPEMTMPAAIAAPNTTNWSAEGRPITRSIVSEERQCERSTPCRKGTGQAAGQ